MKIKGYILAILSAVFYGLIPLFILPLKAIHFPIETTLFYRFLISAGFLFLLLIYRKERLGVNAKELSILALLGILFASSSEFLFIAYDYLSAGVASTLLFVYPIIVALIMTIAFKERLSKSTMLSLLITLGGVFILSTRNSLLDINFAGLAIAMLSALSYAIYIVVVNQARLSCSGIKLTFYSLLFSAVFYLAKALIVGKSLAVPSMAILLNISVFGITTSVISITALIYAIKIIGSTPTAIMGALEPVIAVAVSVILFHEKLTHTLVAGILLILSGVIVNILAEAAKRKRISRQRTNKLEESQVA